MALGTIVACVLSCTTSDGDEDGVTPRRCATLRDHLVDLRLAEVNVATGIDRNAHRNAMQTALGDEFITSCTRSLTESQLNCALRASDATGAAACNANATR
jgi:hypothetical protein